MFVKNETFADIKGCLLMFLLSSQLNIHFPPFNQVMNKEEKGARVAIIGGGPVGCVAAIHFARRGWKVDVFEQRPGNDSPSV